MSDHIDRTPSATGEQLDQQEVPHGTHSGIADNVPLEVKEVTQELLKYGYIEEALNPVLFRKAAVHERAIRGALMPLDLTPRLDTHRGIAFLIVAMPASEPSDGDQAWSHPLVRRHRLTLEQSLLVAILRQAFMIHEQESGIGHSAAKIAIDELLSQFLTYFDDSGSDARNQSRLMNLLDQLKVHGIVSEVDSNLEVTIRPIIAHLANAESLSALLRILKEKAISRERSEPEHE
ncbi:MAG TPA: DUF4194 domain-containing protein [Tepidisphaeraceae bacterium]|jgi:hypothetical protein|nr:DUF4194 domain-containing protein [Tepidisphaeraceae bacterium]